MGNYNTQGYCDGSSGSQYFLYLYGTLNSQDISANKSNITVTMNLQRNDGWAESAWTTERQRCSIYLNGSTVAEHYIPIDTRNSAWVTLATWSGDVYHNSDGSLTVTIGGSFTMPSYTRMTGGSISGSWTLDAIPRASTFSLSPSEATVGESITATIYKANESFYHKLAILYDGHEIATDFTQENTATLDVPEYFADYIPYYWSKATVSARVYTYTSNYGASHIGTEEKWIFLNIPNRDPYIPTFNVSADPVEEGNVPDSWVDGNGKKIFVQGESKVNLLAYSVWAKHGAYIESVTFDGADYEDYVEEPYPMYFRTTGYYEKSGDQSVKVRATDSRGLFSEQTLNFYVYPYAKPVISEVSCIRCEEDGSDSDAGTYLKVFARSLISSVGNRNSATIKVMYRAVGTSSWTNEALLEDSADTVIGGELSPAKSYEVRFVLEDQLGNTAERTVKVSTQKVVFNVRPDGNGMAIGKYAEFPSVLEIDWVTRLNKGLQMDGVPFLESGSNDRGSWLKFYDGTMMTIQKFTHTILSSDWAAWGSVVEYEMEEMPDFPQEFLEPPVCFPEITSAYALWTNCLSHGVSSTTKPRGISISRPMAIEEDISINLSIVSIGRWK